MLPYKFFEKITMNVILHGWGNIFIEKKMENNNFLCIYKINRITVTKIKPP